MQGLLIGLFHLISIHPLWMSCNEGKGGICQIFLICVMGDHMDVNKLKRGGESFECNYDLGGLQ